MAKSGKNPKSGAKKKTTKKKAAVAPKKKTAKKASSSRSSPGKTSGRMLAATRDARKKKVRARVTPYSKEDQEHFRTLLLARRERIVGNVMSMEAEALKASDQDFSVDHMADHGSDNYEQDFTLSLVESERRELFEIDQALERLRQGTYGICEGTGEVIARARLEAIPYARYSVDYQRRIEAGEIEEEDEDEPRPVPLSRRAVALAEEDGDEDDLEEEEPEEDEEEAFEGEEEEEEDEELEDEDDLEALEEDDEDEEEEEDERG